jgi:hypothetical protein
MNRNLCVKTLQISYKTYYNVDTMDIHLSISESEEKLSFIYNIFKMAFFKVQKHGNQTFYKCCMERSLNHYSKWRITLKQSFTYTHVLPSLKKHSQHHKSELVSFLSIINQRRYILRITKQLMRFYLASQNKQLVNYLSIYNNATLKLKYLYA